VHRTRRRVWSRESSTHGLGLVAVLRLARAINQAPRRLVIIGIEGKRFDLGERSECFGRSAVPKQWRESWNSSRSAIMCVSCLANVLENDGPKSRGRARQRTHTRASLSLSTPSPEPGLVVVHSVTSSIASTRPTPRAVARSVVASEICPHVDGESPPMKSRSDQRMPGMLVAGVTALVSVCRYSSTATVCIRSAHRRSTRRQEHGSVLFLPWSPPRPVGARGNSSTFTHTSSRRNVRTNCATRRLLARTGYVGVIGGGLAFVCSSTGSAVSTPPRGILARHDGAVVAALAIPILREKSSGGITWRSPCSSRRDHRRRWRRHLAFTRGECDVLASTALWPLKS